MRFGVPSQAAQVMACGNLSALTLAYAPIRWRQRYARWR
jgi:hypothetical protein